ncbi:hypothetical protein NDN08_004207 [Rhodosorus marinus]|uniref:FANCI solenoid 2 domain-containing protein n=1 Tax=Rhodosorus marinus TaxID=101924 RepID=A0AAV8UMX1_9RHOD|nr:hypothetical protein NDN08_004207 [Rhodosorus marinus]
MSCADRLVQIYENGGNGHAIEDFVNGLKEKERKTLLTELKIRVGASHASVISLFRAEVACSFLRPFAIVTVAVSTANSTFSTASVESYIREAQIGLLEIPYDTSLSRQEKVDELNLIANDILDQIERERISRWHFGAIDIALAAVRCATDQGLQPDGQISSDAIVSRVLDWPWTTATSAGLLDALGTVSLAETSQSKLFKKLRAILNQTTSAEEEFFILGKQIIGMWVNFKGLRIKEWADLVRYAIHAPPDSVCGDLLCVVEIEVSGAASAGTSILENYECLPHRFDGGLSGRDLALILTVSRADDLFLDDAMKIATNMFLVPDDLILHPTGEGSSSPSNPSITSRRRLLNDALKLPGMERSARTVLELAESWIANRRALLPELGVEAFVTVFALQPHARDEVLSEVLATLSESSTSRKVAMSMINILEQLSSTLRGTMRDHLSRVQGWIDYVADLPLDYARRVLAALAPFASLSPAFGDKLLTKLQKLAASRDHSKKSVAVYGLAELVPHLSQGSEGLVESAIDALRVALRRGTVDVRAHVYLGTLGVADSIVLGPESNALRELRQELMRRLATVTDSSGRLVVDKILVNICGRPSVREPIPELLVCISRICGAGTVQPMVEQWLRPTEETFAEFPENEPYCSLWSNVVLGACAALIESGVLTSDSQALEMLDAMIRVKTRPRRHKKRKKSLNASIDPIADSAENSGISHSESNTAASSGNAPEHVGDLLEVEERASPLSLKTALGLAERIDDGTRVDSVFPLMEIILEHLNTNGNKIGWGTTKRLLKASVKWLVITKSELGIVDPIPIHESIVTTPVSMFKKLFFGEVNSAVTKREKLQVPPSSVGSSATEERNDATIPLRQNLVLILRFVTEKFGVTAGRAEPAVSSAVKPLIGDTAIIGRYQTPEFETTADGVLLALCCQFDADFTRSMTVQLSTIYLSSMQSLLKHASDSALKFLSGVMFEILAEYVITQPSVLRGVLLVLYNSMEIEQGIILAATLLLDGRDRASPEKKGLLTDRKPSRISPRNAGAEQFNLVQLSDNEVEERAKSLALGRDERCRTCVLSSALTFLSEALSVAVKGEALLVDVIRGVSGAVGALLLQSNTKSMIHVGDGAHGGNSSGQLPYSVASQAMSIVSTLFRHATAQCDKIVSSTKRGAALAEQEAIEAGLSVLQNIVEDFSIRSGGQGLFRCFLASLATSLQPGNTLIMRSRYQIERLEAALRTLFQLDPSKFGGLEGARDILLRLQRSYSDCTAKVSAKDMISIGGHKLAKKRKKRRVRSRNAYVDEWLHEDDGLDTFADLEDFIVPRDNEPGENDRFTGEEFDLSVSRGSNMDI